MSRYTQDSVAIADRGINGILNTNPWTAQERTDEEAALADTDLGIVARIIFALNGTSKDYVKVKFLHNGKLLGTFKSRDYAQAEALTFRNQLLAEYDIWHTNGFDSLASLSTVIDDSTLTAPSGVGQITATATLADDDDTTVDVTTVATHYSDNPLVASVTAAGVVTGLLAGRKATTTLTVTGQPANNETVTVGDTTYTFKTTLTGAANEVLRGASAAAALDNLKSAVNATAGAGSTYGTGTVENAQVDASTNTDTTQVFDAVAIGTAGNAYVSTETLTTGSFTGATLSGGLAATATITSEYQGESDTVSVTVS